MSALPLVTAASHAATFSPPPDRIDVNAPSPITSAPSARAASTASPISRATSARGRASIDSGVWLNPMSQPSATAPVRPRTAGMKHTGACPGRAAPQS